MTAAQLVRILRRRWALVGLGLVLTCVGALLAASSRGVYWAQINVVFLAPKTSQARNNIVDTTDGVISTAGLIAYDLSAGNAPRVSLPDVTLYGEGLRQTARIDQANSGGQWAINFDQPALRIQAVNKSGSQAELAATRLAKATETGLKRLQAADKVTRPQLITTITAPTKPSVTYVGGSRVRALSASLVLGVSATLWLTITTDRLLLRRSRRAAQ